MNRAVLLLMLLLSSCSLYKAYNGPSRPESDVAIVRAFGVRLVKVNAIELGNDATGVVVLPGQNLIELTINSGNYVARGPDGQVYQLPLIAEAGKEYAVTGERGDARLCAWELSPKTGQPDFRSKPAGCIVAKDGAVLR